MMTQHSFQVSKVASVGKYPTSLGRLFHWLVVLSVKDCPHVQLESPQKQLVPIALCLFHVTPCKREVSVVLVAVIVMQLISNAS